MKSETREILESLAYLKNAEQTSDIEKTCLAMDIEPDEFFETIENRFGNNVHRLAEIENLSFQDAVAFVWDKIIFDSYGAGEWIVEQETI